MSTRAAWWGLGDWAGFWFSETHTEHLLSIWRTVKSEDNVPRLLPAAQTMREQHVGVRIFFLVFVDKFTLGSVNPKQKLKQVCDLLLKSRFSPDRRRQAWIQQAVYTHVATLKAQALPRI